MTSWNNLLWNEYRWLNSKKQPILAILSVRTCMATDVNGTMDLGAPFR